MSFDAYQGRKHIRSFFTWHSKANFYDYFGPEDVSDLVAASLAADTKVFQECSLPIREELLTSMARYNAQDYLFQHAYRVPARNRVKTLLDFGAGHGRIANLGFNTPRSDEKLDTLIAVDGIVSSYFTQAAYFRALGLDVWEYFEHSDDELNRDVISAAISQFDVVHIPTWRLDLIPDGIVDMVVAIQVLKELPGEVVNFVLPQFRRVTHKTGAVYIRDHIQFHNPNHMPIDTLLGVNGFLVEFSPQLKDRVEVHGLPRIWRKVDPDLFV
jgi:hypothetical protein